MKKLLTILFLSLFLISLTSAFEFDNVKDVKETGRAGYPNIEIKNVFGLGKTLWSGELTKNTDVCSSDCLAEQEITLYELGKLVDEIKFMRLLNGRWEESEIRSYQFYVYVDKGQKEVQDYEDECGLDKRGLMQCEQILVGSHFEQDYVWQEFNAEDEFNAGTYKIRLVGNKKQSWIVDWVIKTRGNWLGEWAVWGNISEGDDAEINLSAPAQNEIAILEEVEFNATAKLVSASSIQNVSLWHNGTGTWERNQTEHYVFFGENHTAGSVTGGLAMSDYFGADLYYGQTFNVTKGNFNVNNVSVWLKEATGSGGTYHIAIRGTDAGGLPTGADLSSAIVSISGLGASYTQHNITLSAYELINNTKYALISSCTSCDGGGYFLWGESGSNTYPLGWEVSSTNGGVNWGTEELNDDVWFEFWGNKTTLTEVIFNITIDGPTNWTYQACDIDGDCGFAENRTLFLDVSVPEVFINLPTDPTDIGFIGKNETLNWTAIDTGLESCWYNYNGTNQTLTCSANEIGFDIIADDTNLTFWANDSVGNVNETYITWNYTSFHNSQTYNQTVDEMSNETYIINITTNGTTPTGKLYFNNVNQGSGIVTSNTGNEFILTREIVIPFGSGNQSQYWEVTIGTDIVNSTANNITVKESILGLCNATLTVSYLNITFQDENNQTNLTAAIPTSTFNYWIGSPLVNKSLIYSETSANKSFAFCLSSFNNQTLRMDSRVQYESTSYPQRVFDPDTLTFTNVTTNATLYLLFTSDGQFVTFQVVNNAGQVQSDVFINATRTVGGSTELVGSGFTGGAGTLTLWLDPDFIHNFAALKTGSPMFTDSFAPELTTYTITIGGGGGTPPSDYSRGISYQIGPNLGSLVNGTDYTFNITLVSDFWEVEKFGFVLTNTTGEVLGSNFVSTDGGTATTTINVGNETEISMEYFWRINSTDSNATRYWIILSDAGTDWSIKVLFTDLSTYLSSGMFGLDNFGLAFILFITIFMFTGIVSWKYGFTDPRAIAVILCSLVIFFDVGLGLLENVNPVGFPLAVPNFISIIITIITVSVFIKEGLR